MQMELPLALGLALQSAPLPVKGLDLNSCGYAAPAPGPCHTITGEDEEEEEEITGPRTLPLLLWNHHDDDPADLHCNSSAAIHQDDGEEGELVGWPPVKAWRMKLRRRPKSSTYVKVKMEGVPIGRKIDLSLHRSFDTLMATLNFMFGICGEKATGYELVYQDRNNGDWLLAQDASWRSFSTSVQSLKLLRRRG